VKQYTKILNQNYGGASGLVLGYKANTTEFILKRDQITYFHIPFFSSTIPLSSSSLIENGAIGGPIPAMADRIMRFRGGYANTTPWGPDGNEVTDGVWYGAWLYEDPETKQVSWMDRIYNPGRLKFTEDLDGETSDLEQGGYLPNGEVYKDIPTKMTFLSGGYYQYFHVGENKLRDIIASFAGEDGARQTLFIQPSGTVLERVYGQISVPADVVVKEEKSKELIDVTYIDLETKDSTISVPYNVAYNTTEFTLSFWARHEDWVNSAFSLLAGNYNDGGFGVLNNHTPETFHFVLPETRYGHLLYFNPEGNCYLDQSARINNNLVTKPDYVFANDLGDTWVVSTTYFSETSLILNVYKTNYNGVTQRVARDSSGIIMGFGQDEEPVTSKLDANENLHLLTTNFYYIFDKDLLLLSQTTPILTAPCCYLSGGEVRFRQNSAQYVIDANNTAWRLTHTGILYKGTAEVKQNVEKCLEGPDGNMWVLHDKKDLSVLDIVTLEEKFNITNLGEDILNETRSFSFQLYFNKKTNVQQWRCVVISSAKQLVYYYTLDGALQEVIPLRSFIDYTKASEDEDESLYAIDLNPNSDWTGYEWKRARGVKGFEILISTSDYRLPSTVFNKTERIPVPTLVTNDSWIHIALKAQNKTYSVFINGVKVKTFSLSPNVDISYNSKNSFYYGSFPGKNAELRSEIASKALVFNGHLGNLRIYNYPLPDSYIERFFLSLWKGQDLIWDIPTASLNYIEEIDGYFQHRFPSSKSKAYRVRIYGHNMQDPTLRKMVESMLKDRLKELEPAYTDLLQIDWA
jgi:hypothetical protein